MIHACLLSAWVSSTALLGFLSRGSPVYIVHESPVWFSSGVRVWACDGMLIVQSVEFGGFPSQRKTAFRTMVDITGVNDNPMPYAVLSEWGKRQRDPSVDSFTTPRFTLPGPSWRHAGGFYTFAWRINWAPVGWHYIRFITVPIYFLVLAPVMLFGAWIIWMFLARRKMSTLRGFEISSVRD